jgi:hypothetical protein
MASQCFSMKFMVWKTFSFTACTDSPDFLGRGKRLEITLNKYQQVIQQNTKQFEIFQPVGLLAFQLLSPTTPTALLAISSAVAFLPH